jgi:hypothetical protein
MNAISSEHLAGKAKNYKFHSKSPVRVFTKIVHKDVYIRHYAVHSSKFRQRRVQARPPLFLLDEVCQKKPVSLHSNDEGN